MKKDFIVVYNHKRLGEKTVHVDTESEVKQTISSIVCYGHKLKYVKVQVWKPYGTTKAYELDSWYIDKSFK